MIHKHQLQTYPGWWSNDGFDTVWIIFFHTCVVFLLSLLCVVLFIPVWSCSYDCFVWSCSMFNEHWNFFVPVWSFFYHSFEVAQDSANHFCHNACNTILKWLSNRTHLLNDLTFKSPWTHLDRDLTLKWHHQLSNDTTSNPPWSWFNFPMTLLSTFKLLSRDLEPTLIMV